MKLIPTKVQPGDLITSEYMNSMVECLEDLNDRLIRLETPITSPSGTRILNLLPSGTKRIGDTLYIIGQGFASGTGTVVTIDGIGVGFTAGADRDRELIATIPNVQGVSAAGKLVTVLVTNSGGTDTEDFIVFPAEVSVPQGQVFVTYTQPPGAAQINAGGSYTFEYNVRAITDLDETYTISATVDAGWSAALVDSSDNPITPPEVFLPSAPGPAGASQTVRIRVSVPGGLSNGDAGLLRVAALSQQNPSRLFGRSGGENLVVGNAPPSPFPIEVSLSNVVRTSPIQPSATTTGGVVRIGPGPNNYRLDFSAQLKASTVYTIQLTPPSDSRWNASFSAAANQTTRSIGPLPSDAGQPIAVFLRGGSSAPDDQLILQVTSTSDATQIGRVTQDVGLLP